MAAGLLATACARVLLRRAPVRSQSPSGVAVVVREMQPGAYGQIRVDSAGRSVVMAAQNLDSEPLPEGCEVIVLTGDRSVVAVRRAEPRT